MSADLVWGIFVRLVALTYVIAFLSLRAEIVALAGENGLNPLAAKLARMRADLGTWTAAVRHPSLFWLGASDRALRWLPLAGILTAALVVCGVASTPMLAATWIIYLSFDVAVGLAFPWESMLFEAGFLAIFLPSLQLLPSLRMTHPPEPILMFAFQWLLFRVVFGFGKNKFTREAVDDPTYLRSFLICQPLVSPLGWRAWRLPRQLFVWGHALLFIIEIPLPFLVFFAGWPRLAAAAGITGLMAAIQMMGSFGFFNLLAAILCVPLLDPRPLTSQTWAALASPHGVASVAVVTWSLLAGLCHLPFNTWVSRGWPEWPVWGAFTGFGGAVVGILRGAMPFRTAHAYGVFPPRMGPPLKFLPVIEGTRDGVRWETFEYRYMPSTEHSPPKWAAPHCPRIDHFALYEAYGLPGNYLGTIFSQGNPYDFSPVSTKQRLLERLMDPRSSVRDLFRVVPFDGRPPASMRIRLYVFAPTTPAEMKTTGQYWHRDLVGEHVSERGPDPTIYQRWLPAPEQFHPDERWARRRVPRFRSLLRARNLDEVRRTLDEPARMLWDPFWDDLIPSVDRAAQTGWPSIELLAQRVEDTYGTLAVDGLDRIRGAVTTVLLERMEPHVLGLAKPKLEVASYFHASLIAHAVVLGGRACTEAALGRDARPPESSARGMETRALMLLTVLRRDMMVLHARTQRLIAGTLPPQPVISEAVPGFPLVMPLLADGLTDASEQMPALTRLPDGEWAMNGEPILSRRLSSWIGGEPHRPHIPAP